MKAKYFSRQQAIKLSMPCQDVNEYKSKSY